MVGYSEALPGTGKKIILRYNGLFDFDGMYAAITDWAKNYGFMWHEKDYKHKVPSPKGAEQEFTWVLTKNVTQYIRNEITIKLHAWELLEVEVDQGGRKIPLSNARLYLWIEPKVTFDWQRKFQGSGKFGEWLGKWYNKLLDKDFSNYLDELYYRTWDLHAIIKTYFDVQTRKYAYKGYMKEN
ncbi:MAG: hypothetical protein WCV90_01810 [Candidatus Woesearchaeota archaeon]|jgi:hypothetical protein